MAKQKGIVPLEGTIGNITFYKTRDGYLAKEKSGVSAERINNDPAFARTRENMAEFSKAAAAGRQLYSAFKPALQGAADRRMIGRLIKKTSEVVKLDTTHPRGQRLVMPANLPLLQGFEFNSEGQLDSTLNAPVVVEIDRTPGTVDLHVDRFVPQTALAAPTGTTHYRIKAAAAEMDFATGASAVTSDDSGYLPWNAVETSPLDLGLSVSAGSTKAILVLLGVEFFQEVNTVKYPLQNGAHNAFALVDVEA